MNKIKICIWNRIFELPVFFRNCDDVDETVRQKEAIEKFANEKEMLDNSKNAVEAYICKRQPELKEQHPVSNLFRYVIPKSIYLPESEKRVVAVLCDYKFDMEHGIAVIFENEKLKEIGSQDIIL